ncbi:hypothetical protein HF086_015772 [Spodoptera exigua]|uniref:Uncharacterized protein n=1 Tax=Spodoptera exigua TaxID=7107 RepID=A0A922M338_SPOEX|nr:hypothetical protein HF086_015772 [Spodoptera exigua]
MSLGKILALDKLTNFFNAIRQNGGIRASLFKLYRFQLNGLDGSTTKRICPHTRTQADQNTSGWLISQRTCLVLPVNTFPTARPGLRWNRGCPRKLLKSSTGDNP